LNLMFFILPWLLISAVYFCLPIHNILLRKLSNFGLSSSHVDWFHSYVFNRQSFVRISGTVSFPYLVKCRVPQGSTLGPLLFNIFINNILPIERIMAYATCLHHNPYLGKQSVFFIKH
jgi:hypothetical protein